MKNKMLQKTFQHFPFELEETGNKKYHLTGHLKKSLQLNIS